MIKYFMCFTLFTVLVNRTVLWNPKIFALQVLLLLTSSFHFPFALAVGKKPLRAHHFTKISTLSVPEIFRT